MRCHRKRTDINSALRLVYYLPVNSRRFKQNEKHTKPILENNIRSTFSIGKRFREIKFREKGKCNILEKDDRTERLEFWKSICRIIRYKRICWPASSEEQREKKTINYWKIVAIFDGSFQAAGTMINILSTYIFKPRFNNVSSRW